MENEALVDLVLSGDKKEFFFESDWNNVYKSISTDKFEQRIEQELNELIALCDEWEEARDVEPRIELVQEQQENNETLKAMDEMWVIRAGFQEVESLMELDELQSSLASLQNVKSKLASFKTKWQQCTLASNLNRQAEDIKKNILKKVDDDWNNSVKFEDGMEVTLSSDVYEVVQNEDTMSSRKEMLLQSIEDKVIMPILELKVKEVSIQEGNVLKFDYGTPKLMELKMVIEETIEFLNNVFKDTLSTALPKRFSSIILTNLKIRTLPSLFPTKRENVERFEMELKEFVGLEFIMQDLGWTKGFELTEWVRMFESEWIKQRKSCYMMRIRGEIVDDSDVFRMSNSRSKKESSSKEEDEEEDDGWNQEWDDSDEEKEQTNDWDWDDDDDPEMFSTTTNVQKLVDILTEFHKEMKDPELGQNESGDLMLFFRALAPHIYESPLLEYNDMNRLHSSLEPLIPPKEHEKLKMHVERCLNDIVDTKLTDINQKIMIADGFHDCNADANLRNCQMAVNSCSTIIKQAAEEWKKYTSFSLVCQMLAKLVDNVMTSIMISIESQPDISEEESKQLAKIMRQVIKLEDLFVINTSDPKKATENAAGYIESYIKFQYFGMILQSSLVDIVYLYENGSLIDYNKLELVKLIKALFADSEYRSDAISKISPG